MKIKTFKFVGCNLVYGRMVQTNESHSAKEIDEKVNEFIEANAEKVIDIKINTIESRYNNQGSYNTVELLYTVMYEPKE